MIQSMTGFGAGECVDQEVAYAAELRSVNNRYLKLSLKLPDRFSFAEASVEKLLRSRLSRGSVTYALRVRDERATAGAVSLAALQAYVEQLARVEVSAGVQRTIDLASLVTLPGVCQMPEVDEEARAQQLVVIERVTVSALDQLAEMRLQEGRALCDDLLQACGSLREQVDQIRTAAPRVIGEYHQRLSQRVALLLKESNLKLDEDSLRREVAIFAERCDVSEELARLGSHLDQFAELCRRDEQVGRKLDFLTQELLREANTIASKSNDAQITRCVLEAKVLVDRLREQVQNVE